MTLTLSERAQYSWSAKFELIGKYLDCELRDHDWIGFGWKSKEHHVFGGIPMYSSYQRFTIYGYKPILLYEMTKSPKNIHF